MTRRLRARWAIGCASWAHLVGAGCAAPEPPRIVALLGCGLDEPSDEPAFTSLRVQARGDFPLDDDALLLIRDGIGRLRADPDAIAGVTVEGLLGENTVTAVGRTTRLHDAGELPVWFAPPDQWCALQSTVGFREAGGIAAGLQGDVLVVGGRDGTGAIIDDIVHVRDDEDVAVTRANALPIPSTGHSVHAVGERRFFVLGGTGIGDKALSSYVQIDLDAAGATVSDPIAIDRPGIGRAYHGAAQLPDDRIFVAGGCTGFDLGSECYANESTVLRSSYTITWHDDGPVFADAPDLFVARYGHQLHAARDGVVYAVGGRDVDGAAVTQAERLLPGATGFEPYGPNALAPVDPDSSCPWGSDVAAEQPVESSALLDGGMLVLALADGTIRWVTQTEAGCLRDWCGSSGPCFVEQPPSLDPWPRPRRTMLALPGERVLVDAFVLPVGNLDRTGAHAIDLSRPTVDNPRIPPEQRVGTAMALLADGSVIVAAGRDPLTGAPAQPFFARLRPALDGPDERIPEVGDPRPGSMLALQPDRIFIENARLRMLGTGADEMFPSVRARVRAFRSTSFRFEVTLQSDGVDVVPHIVLERGGVAMTSIALEPSGVRAHTREATGEIVSQSCTATPLDFATPQSMRVDVRPGSIKIRLGGVEIAACSGPGEQPSTIGVGLSGTGELAAFGIRLSRI